MTDGERLLDAVLRLTTALQRDMETGLAAVGLTPARAHLVGVLVTSGPQPQQALARQLEVTPRNVTGLVDALERDGFVTREPQPTDRRASIVTLTARGREVADGLVAGRRELGGQLARVLPAGRVAALADDVAALADEVERLAGGAR
ncbi:MarR family winged helix-turn-helix transcriptional regulator [Nocardioides zeae]|uniref:MarR family transcriptional regulator n=1 Tax=Nocardioides zeae TaxID=1457234 RepID=A0A6P0HJY3_9ACTN|nr:MarR family transcriptional regulator [Nocardioides zeae]NEN78570.1 MarR family transcriptional regulator [Nocardioides zeae]